MTGDLNVRWIHGSPSAKHDRDPEIQVHRYDERTVILRHSHSHGDHVAGDPQFADRRDTTVVAADLPAADLRSIRQAIEQVGDTPGIHPFDNFVLYHGIPDRHFGLGGIGSSPPGSVGGDWTV